MVQGEKTNMLSATSCMARTMDPFARYAFYSYYVVQQAMQCGILRQIKIIAILYRKAGHEAAQRLDKQMSSQSSKEAAAPSKTTSTPATNYGSWGPVFQNKQTFAQMHWC